MDSAFRTINSFLRSDVSAEDKTAQYNAYAPKYEHTSEDAGYSGPTKCAEIISSYFPTGRDAIEVLDVGAGTGLVAEKFRQKGFITIDGVEPSPEMLEIAAKKNIYRRLVCDYVTVKPINGLKERSYDVITAAGTKIPGHIPYDGILEMIRVTRKGGIVCVVNRKSTFYETPEYSGKFFPLVDRLKENGTILKADISTFSNFYTGVEGIVIVLFC